MLKALYILLPQSLDLFQATPLGGFQPVLLLSTHGQHTSRILKSDMAPIILLSKERHRGSSANCPGALSQWKILWHSQDSNPECVENPETYHRPLNSLRSLLGQLWISLISVSPVFGTILTFLGDGSSEKCLLGILNFTAICSQLFNR